MTQQDHSDQHRGAQPFSTESYFQTQKPPAGLGEKTAQMAELVDRWRGTEGQRVVLVTVSG